MHAKDHCFPESIIIQAVYFKVRFSLIYQDVEEIMKIREVDKDGQTIDFLLTKRRQRMSAQSVRILHLRSERSEGLKSRRVNYGMYMIFYKLSKKSEMTPWYSPGLSYCGK